MSRRRLSDEERALWQGVTRSIAPLRKAAVAAPVAPARSADESASIADRAQRGAGNPDAGSAPAAGLRAQEPRARSGQTVAPLGRKMKLRIARGRHAIEGRLDLHGMTQAEAHDALLRFLRGRQARGAKLVLVITGKGGGASEGRGVLKRMVPQWLQLPEFRGLVAGFESAAIGHGGEGALYISLRKAR